MGQHKFCRTGSVCLTATVLDFFFFSNGQTMTTEISDLLTGLNLYVSVAAIFFS